MYVGHEENKRDDLEALYTIVKAGVASAMSGKDINLFGDNKQGNSDAPKNVLTEEERTKNLNELDSIFE